MRNKPSLLPNYVGIVTSQGFLVLAVVLYYADYPFPTVIGQICQCFLSSLIWTPFSIAKKLIWVDRSAAVLNMVLLGSAHLQQGMLIIDMWPALALTILFKLADWHIGGEDLSPWYIWWHFNLIANNASMALSKDTLPLVVYVVQHAVAAIHLRYIRSTAGHEKPM